MTHQEEITEKARQIVWSHMAKISKYEIGIYTDETEFKVAKQCALIDVQNTINALSEAIAPSYLLDFYFDVKLQIEKI